MLTTRPNAIPSDKALAHFIAAIHESLDISQVGRNYMAAIRHLIGANAYGLYLLSPECGRPRRVAVSGGVDRFIARYEQEAYAHDPLLVHMARTREPVHNGLLFSETEWQRTTFRQALTTHHQAPRLLEAPLVIGGRLQGFLCFSRRPDDAAPFGVPEIRTLKSVAQHVCSAIDHALRFAALKERCTCSEGTLQLINVPIVLSDQHGRIRFANRAAELALSGADETLHSERFQEVLRENLEQLEASTSIAAAGSLGLRRPVGRPRTLVVRSARVPSAEHVVATFLTSTEAPTTASFDHLAPLLSERELEILALLAQGLQNKEIARRLFVSTNTVKYHLKRMYRAMRVNSRAELLSKVYAGS